VVAKKLLLFKAFLKKEFILFRRYLVNSIGGMLTIYVIFLLLLGSYRGLVGGGDHGDTVEQLVVGYVLWFFMLSTYQDVAYTLRREAKEGTLEQLYMSVHGFGWVMGAKAAAGFFVNSILVVILLRAVMVVTGSTLNIDLLSIVPITIFTLIGILGIGFTVGGLTLVFKRIESFTQMIQFALVALVAVDPQSVWWVRLLPGSYGASLVRRVMIGGAHLSNLGFWECAFFIVISLGHLGLGYGIYRLCERKAMSEGLLGHY